MDSFPDDGAGTVEVELTYSGTSTRRIGRKRYAAGFHGRVCLATGRQTTDDSGQTTGEESAVDSRLSSVDSVEVLAGPPGASAVIDGETAVLRIPLPAIPVPAETPAARSAAP